MGSSVGVAWQRDFRFPITLGCGGLGFSGFFGWRYREMKRRLAALETAVSQARGTTVIHNHTQIVSDPPDLGDVNEIRTMTQAEYDRLPAKKEKTMYLILNGKSN